MAKVYVSSTVADLRRERQAVMDWLVAAQLQPVHSYRPNSETVRESCLDDVDFCDLYVLILGSRYGFQPPDHNPEGLSITHLEFRRAGQSGIPRIALLRTSSPHDSRSDTEDPQELALVRAFREEVEREVRTTEFGDLQGLIHGLSTGVMAELAKLEQQPARRQAARRRAASRALGMAPPLTIQPESGEARTEQKTAQMTVAGRSVFISYRRQLSESLALLVSNDLVKHGFDTFVDLENLDSGEFERTILSQIEARDHFIVLVQPGSLDRIGEDGDWLRREIAHALAHGRNVVPVTAQGFEFRRDLVLPPDVARLPSFNAVPLQMTYFAAAMQLLRTRFLKSPSKLTAPPLPETLSAVERGRRSLARPEEPASAGAPVLRAPRAPLVGPKIFLCYRREDTQAFARGIYESLVDKYGSEQIFRDIDSTPVGVKTSAWIDARVGQCNVMIVLIGHSWLSAKAATGQRRLDLPKDWIRQEIETALRHDIPIIPVRVQGAPMPSENDLPSSIADFTGFQSAEVTDSRWDYDVGLLIQAIDGLIVSD